MTKKNIEIEYLRAVAVAMVSFVHLGHLMPWPKRWFDSSVSYFGMSSGVDLFFCISGFVVASSFVPTFDRLASQGKPWQATLSFWVRRMYRLLPSAWAWLLIYAACAIWFNNSGAFSDAKTVLKSAVFVVTYTANFAQSNGLMGNLGHYWSLALEEQFYVLFPLFLLVFPGRLRWQALIAMLLAHLFIGSNQANAPFWRINSALWGVLIYCFSITRAYKLLVPRLLEKRALSLAACAALLFFALRIPTTLYPWPWMFSLLGIPCAALVLLASYDRGYVWPPSPWLRSLLAWMGSRSYAIYLIHVPVFCLVHEATFRISQWRGEPLTSSYAPYSAVSAVALICILAELNFRLLESPSRRQGIAVSQRLLIFGQATVSGKPG